MLFTIWEVFAQFWIGKGADIRSQNRPRKIPEYSVCTGLSGLLNRPEAKAQTSQCIQVIVIQTSNNQLDQLIQVYEQGSHKNSKTQFRVLHDFFMINNLISMTI